MYKIILTLIIIFFFTLSGNSQLQQEMPKVLLPSPEVSDLAKFTHYGLDYKTGTPQVSIPLFEIVSGSIKLPIALYYNGNGRRVFDETGAIAIGWSLQAGANISRQVKGAPDEKVDRFSFTKPQWEVDTKDDFDHLADNYYGLKDGGYDIYTYQLPSGSGRFILDGSGSTSTPRLFKPAPVKFGPLLTHGIPGTMWDGEGNYYVFGESEYSSGPTRYSAINTCNHVTSIISADKKDTVTFTYVTKEQRRHAPVHQIVVKDNDIGQLNPSFSVTYPTNATGYSSHYIKRLQQITFRGGKVTFTIDNSAEGRITEISLLDKDNRLIKRVAFTSAVLDTPTQAGTASKTKLTKVEFKSSLGLTVEKYDLEYLSSNYSISTSRDFWGFFNGYSNSTSVPQIGAISVYQGYNAYSQQTYTFPNSGNRTASIASQAGMLSKVTHPTGGTTEFLYEVNKLKTGTNVFDGPGVRVKEIKISDKTSTNVQTRTFAYGENEDGVGRLFWSTPYYTDMAFEMLYFPKIFTSSDNLVTGRYSYYRRRTYTSNIVDDLSDAANEPVMYTKVTEYNGTPEVNSGKTEYYFSLPNTYQVASSFWPGFPSSTPGHNFSFTYVAPREIGHKSIWQSNFSSEAKLIQVKIYKRNGSSYDLVKTTTNNYSITNLATYKGLNVYKEIETRQDAGIYFTRSWDENSMGEIRLPIFSWLSTEVVLGAEQLISTVEIESSDNGSLTNNTSYSYNSFGLRTTIIKQGSNGNTTTSIKYPNDMLTDGALGGISTQMVNNNMLNYPIETIVQNGSQATYAKKIYSTVNGRVLLSKVQTKIGNDSYEDRILYQNYDARGNLSTIKKNADIETSYIWNYAGVYPTAEVKNASVANIAYTSFEGDNGGTWSYTGVTYNDVTAPTGKFGYKLTNSSNNLVKNNLNASLTYIVSYWKKDGSITVNSTSPSATGRTVKGWTFYEHRIVNPVGGTITVSGSNAHIDEVRLFPSNAHMSTFTFDPIIGMTSQCDFNNQLRYYEYDEFNRLIFVRDDQANILKRYCYNINGQGVACDYFSNDSKTGIYTRNNCSPGFTGGSVQVNIPAGMFTSTISKADANNKAVAYGQEQANLLGACTSSSVTIFCNNNVSSGTVYMQYYNQATGQLYNFSTMQGTSINLGTIPAGTYTISIGTSNYNSNYYFTVACGFFYYGTNATFYNVTVDNSCRIISVSPY